MGSYEKFKGAEKNIDIILKLNILLNGLN